MTTSLFVTIWNFCKPHRYKNIFPLSSTNHKFYPQELSIRFVLMNCDHYRFTTLTIKHWPNVKKLWIKTMNHQKMTFVIFMRTCVSFRDFSRKFCIYGVFLEFMGLIRYRYSSMQLQLFTRKCLFIHVTKYKARFQWLSIRWLWSHHTQQEAKNVAK
jgi:hypothetical protein